MGKVVLYLVFHIPFVALLKLVMDHHLQLLQLSRQSALLCDSERTRKKRKLQTSCSVKVLKKDKNYSKTSLSIDLGIFKEGSSIKEGSSNIQYIGEGPSNIGGFIYLSCIVMRGWLGVDTASFRIACSRSSLVTLSPKLISSSPVAAISPRCFSKANSTEHRLSL